MAYKKSKKGANLRRWLKEEWTDQNGKPCGSSETKGIKKCRPKKKISSKTPKTWSEVSNKKEALVAEKRRVGMGAKTGKAKHGGQPYYNNQGIKVPGMTKK